MNTTWKESLNDRRLLALFVVSMSIIIVLAFTIDYYFREIIQPRNGTQLNDWLLTRMPSIDCSLTIFIILYAVILQTVLVHFRNPQVIVTGLAVYAGATVLRMATIYAFKLEAPQGMIILNDPLISRVVYPSSFTKDLFFSGHTSTMVIMVLIEPIKILRWIKIAATAVLAVLLLLQHIHYTIDIVFAPVFTLGVYEIVMWLKKPRTN